MKVQCPACKALTHKTTDAYNPNERPHRAMVELLEPYKSWGWGDGFHDVECPACESPLAPAGRLRIVPDDHGVVKVKSLEEGNQELIDAEYADVSDAEPITKAEQIRDLLYNSDMTIKAIASQVGTSDQYVRNIQSKVRDA